ncbi:MAG: sigma-54 dependent transcriptional regulator [Opitutales bacterium]|nr:sigma-54 dependent transcriptional regulator [Opitutales bacterium]NRA28360.1 sigma-54-dependent Fis family transcriptional regulator [Opitutales bacterium]
MAIEKLIVLDDDLTVRKSLAEKLRTKRYSVAEAESIAHTLDLLSRDQFDLVFVDSRLPDGEGQELLEQYSTRPDAPMFIMITGFGTIESAVECMKLGAFDYIIKPFGFEQIEVALSKAKKHNQLLKVNQYFSNESQSQSEMIGASTVMRRLKKMIQKVAATEATVLVMGENGTGKEMVARELYRLSPRASQPFIRVNCAAISENLIESEFFGHEKGAFTGATQRREGRFELANNGTILLDEIGEISPAVQVKLLRVLQEREFERVGGNTTISVDVRVIASTNRNLMEAVERGEFREDLYYRLNVFPIDVPALRQRKDDIPGLATKFLQNFSKKHRLDIPGFTQDALDLLLAHDWPGNVRELQNTIERSVILADDGEAVPGQYLGIMPKKAKVSELVPVAAGSYSFGGDADSASIVEEAAPMSPPSFASSQSMEEVEKQHILIVLKEVQGNRTRAAEVLDMNIRTLRNKLTKYAEAGEDVSGLSSE